MTSVNRHKPVRRTKRTKKSAESSSAPAWACRWHRVPAGEHCSLCADQETLFAIPEQPSAADVEQNRGAQ